MTGRLLTVHDVAEALQKTPRWVAETANRGDIPSVRIGGSLRFRPEAVDNYIAAREVGVHPSVAGVDQRTAARLKRERRAS